MVERVGLTGLSKCSSPAAEPLLAVPRRWLTTHVGLTSATSVVLGFPSVRSVTCVSRNFPCQPVDTPVATASFLHQLLGMMRRSGVYVVPLM